MNTQFIKQCLSFLTCIGVTCQVANAAPVTVPDFSFENTTNIAPGGSTGAPDMGPSWLGSGNGGVFLQNITNTLFSGTTLPAPADGTNYAVENINGHTARCWQDIGPLKSNTVYTLTVAVGNSLQFSTGQGVISLINGVNSFGAPLGSAPVDSGTVTAGSFSDFTLVFTNGYQASGDLTILLEGDTGAQLLFDNVRLDAANAPAAAAALPISVSPGNTVFVGTLVTLTENPAGTPSFFYQWQTDNGSGGASWSNTGGNSTNLQVNTAGFTPGTPVQFQVIVTNNSGSSTSAPIALTANNSQPIVMSDTVPAIGSDVVGSSVTFSAQFQGTLPIGYQWFFSDLNNNTVSIGGATNSTLTVANLQLTNAGFYFLEASNSLGILDSATRIFLVTNAFAGGNPGVFISQANQCGLGGSTQYDPTWSVVTNGDLLLGSAPTFAGGNFTLEGTGGTPFLTDGKFGTLPPEGNAGIGLATAGNNAGTNIIYTLPANTLGWDLTNITVYGGWSDTGRDDQRFQVYYFTTANATNYLQIADVDFRPESTVISGSAVTISGHQSATRVIITSTNGVFAHNVAGLKFVFNPPIDPGENGYEGYAEIQAFGSNSTTAVPTPPGFQDVEPASAFDIQGNSITFTASFSSTTPLTYQWLKDGVAIPNATNASLTFSNLQISDSSQAPGYSVLATNAGGFAVSSVCPLLVSSAPSPDSFGVIDSLSGQTGNSSSFTPTWTVAPGSLLVGLLPTTASYNGGNFNNEGCGGIPVINDGQFGHVGGANNITLMSCGNGGAGHTLVYTLPAGSGAGYNISNIVTYAGWSDNGRDAQAYTISYSTVSSPLTFTTLDTVSQVPGQLKSGPNGDRVTLAPSAGVFLATNVYALMFDFTTPVAASQENGWSGYAELQVFGAPASTLANLAPSLAQDILPATGSDVVGSTVKLTAIFTGTSPISYQWYQGGNVISGATGPTLTLNNLQLTNSGNYNVVAYSSFGTNSSSTNTFTVNPAPSAVNGTLNAQAYQAGYAGLGLTPTWALASGSLIAGQFPSAVGSGNFKNEGCGGANILTAGSPGSYAAGNGNLASCGPGAGTSVTYTLAGSATGYNLNGIAVYAGWADTGRDENGFAVSYATASSPNTFVPLTSPQTTFDFLPGGAAVANATRQTVTSSTASPLAQNVVAVRIDFNMEENGWGGFGQIQLFGNPSSATAAPQFTSAKLSGGNLIMVGSGGSPGTGYTLLSTTNIAVPVSAWKTNTTGTFDVSGVFSNAIGVTLTNEFFLLRTP